ncbi:MAG TPA: hypothetical protein DHV72_15660 [Serratia grimesii]|uniref:Uncharacterized protein n=1 Tax=Serratia grimesii TaxID=82995 RepID=A0A9C7QY39_9GAMM|nr:hypothetical protein [Serratia grimesii]
MHFKPQLGDQHGSPHELTLVSDWGDKSVGNRCERCLQRPLRAWPTDGPPNCVQLTTLWFERRRVSLFSLRSGKAITLACGMIPRIRDRKPVTRFRY